eukprot:15404949-Alexandrium_andersonii.AAC.1
MPGVMVPPKPTSAAIAAPPGRPGGLPPRGAPGPCREGSEGRGPQVPQGCPASAGRPAGGPQGKRARVPRTHGGEHVPARKG